MACLVITALLPLLSTAANLYDDPTPSNNIGAFVYATRCVLCHGSQGMGEGALPMSLKNYPDTNVVLPKHTANREEILRVTVFGATNEKISTHMPPFGKELTWTELESVAGFIQLLRSNKNEAYKLLTKHSPKTKANKKVGQQIFDTRCVLCHGKFAEGDGRMSKLLKDPPPADLTASRMPEQYLKQIIEQGGEAMGRSKHMPPWGDQLSESEIDSVIVYLKSIRD